MVQVEGNVRAVPIKNTLYDLLRIINSLDVN